MFPRFAAAACIATVAAVAFAVPSRLAAQTQQSVRITCGSTSNVRQNCETGNYIVAARVEADRNGKRCRQNSTWGFTNSTIWTSSGCWADFIVTFRNGGVISGTPNGTVNGTVNGTGAMQTIRCGDSHGARVQCATNGYATSVRVARQLVPGACKPNETWGYTDSYVWTSNMCIGEFEVTYASQNGTYPQPSTAYPNGQYSNGGVNGAMGTRVISCGPGSGNNGNGNANGNGKGNGNGNGNGRGNRYGNRNRNEFSCDAGGRIAAVQLVRSDDADRCQLGNTFGFEGRRIWTRRGCRGDFEVTYAAGRNR